MSASTDGPSAMQYGQLYPSRNITTTLPRYWNRVWAAPFRSVLWKSGVTSPAWSTARAVPGTSASSDRRSRDRYKRLGMRHPRGSCLAGRASEGRSVSPGRGPATLETADQAKLRPIEGRYLVAGSRGARAASARLAHRQHRLLALGDACARLPRDEVEERSAAAEHRPHQRIGGPLPDETETSAVGARHVARDMQVLERCGRTRPGGVLRALMLEVEMSRPHAPGAHRGLQAEGAAVVQRRDAILRGVPEHGRVPSIQRRGDPQLEILLAISIDRDAVGPTDVGGERDPIPRRVGQLELMAGLAAGVEHVRVAVEQREAVLPHERRRIVRAEAKLGVVLPFRGESQ